MTLDEHIHKAEEDAKMAEFDTEWGIGNYFIDRTEALEYAKECRQLAEWLKDYKRLKEQEPCEDAISREAIKKDLKNCMVTEIRDEDDDLVGYYNADTVDSIVRNLPSVKPQEPKWIPVSERLPDNNDDVLVYDYSDIFVAWYSGIDGNWCSADRRFDEYTPIIAWMPLPKPYEGK